MLALLASAMVLSGESPLTIQKSAFPVALPDTIELVREDLFGSPTPSERKFAASPPFAKAGATVTITFDANEELPRASQEFLDQGGYLVDAGGVFGTQTLERWTGYSKFLFDQGLLVDSAGKPLPKALDYSALYTNDFLQ